MEEKNDLNPQSSPVEEKPTTMESKNSFNPKNWLIFFTILYAITLIPAFILISRKETRKDSDKELIASSLTKKNAVGIIPIHGPIYQDSNSSFIERGSQLISSRIKKMSEDKKIKAIVLDINSPGGSVAAVQEIYSTILKAKKETAKPFIARFGEVSASGGYYIASACDKIIAHPGTITGSIGVIFSVGNVEGLFKKIGVKTETIKSGKFKDIGAMSREMSKEERELLQSMINDSFESFVNAVSEGRKIDKEKLKDLADGRIFTGNQAFKVGLVDKLGDLQDAIDEAGIMANLGKNPPVVKNKRYYFDDILEAIDSKISILPQSASISPIARLEYMWSGF